MKKQIITLNLKKAVITTLLSIIGSVIVFMFQQWYVKTEPPVNVDSEKQIKSTEVFKQETSEKSPIKTPETSNKSQKPKDNLLDKTPIASQNVELNSLVTVGDDEYNNTIKAISISDECYISYNLKSRYKILNCKVGTFNNNIDSIWPTWFRISGDGRTLKEGNLEQGDLPGEFDINVQGVKCLKIEGQGLFIINPFLTPN